MIRRTEQGEDQKKNSRQPIITLHQCMGHIMNNHQQQKYSGKNDQEQEQAIFCRMVGFCLDQVKKRFAFLVPDRKRCGGGSNTHPVFSRREIQQKPVSDFREK